MKSIDVQDDLADGVESAPLPVMGRDGGPILEPARPIADPPPRLCEAGPCRHYHRMAVQMDAQNPMAERRDGVLIRHAATFAVLVSHYCYPDVGIETKLGSMPVLECNRWVPITGLLERVAGVRKRYERELERWHAGKEAEVAEVSEAVAASVAEVPLTVMVVTADYDGSTPVSMPGDTSIENVITAAMVHFEAALGPVSVADLHRSVVTIGNAPIRNLVATIHQLDLAPHTVITVTISKERA